MLLFPNRVIREWITRTASPYWFHLRLSLQEIEKWAYAIPFKIFESHRFRSLIWVEPVSHYVSAIPFLSHIAQRSSNAVQFPEPWKLLKQVKKGVKGHRLRWSSCSWRWVSATINMGVFYSIPRLLSFFFPVFGFADVAIDETDRT